MRVEIHYVIGIGLSDGMTAKIIQKGSRALANPYTQLLEQLWLERFLNIDETGHRENGKLMWARCFRAREFTLFHTLSI